MRKALSTAVLAVTSAAALYVAAPGRAAPQEAQTLLSVLDATPSKATTSTDCTFVIERSGDLSRTTRVEYDTDSGTAKEDRHFTAAIGVLDYAADETTKTIVVDVVKQKFRNSSFTLRIFNPSSNTSIQDEEGFCVLKRR
jgi:Calx-beta domain-containing protein